MAYSSQERPISYLYVHGGIEHVTKSAGYPMSYEILERAIRTVKNTLDKARKTGVDPYLAMLSIRATPISDKIPSPARLLLGRKLQINMSSYATPPDNRDITMQQLTQRKHSQEFYLGRHARTRHPLIHGNQITVKTPITTLIQIVSPARRNVHA